MKKIVAIARNKQNTCMVQCLTQIAKDLFGDQYDSLYGHKDPVRYFYTQVHNNVRDELSSVTYFSDDYMSETPYAWVKLQRYQNTTDDFKALVDYLKKFEFSKTFLNKEQVHRSTYENKVVVLFNSNKVDVPHAFYIRTKEDGLFSIDTEPIREDRHQLIRAGANAMNVPPHIVYEACKILDEQARISADNHVMMQLVFFDSKK